MRPLALGVLGAARITPLALAAPARAVGARLVCVAARDRGRAVAFAAEHGVERVLSSYEEVLADPEVEAVYNPLPNALHAPWNLAAVRAGKHVLSEKPFASDGAGARRVRDAARTSGLVVVDGFHYLFHPVTQRLHALLASGELGTLARVEVTMAMPAPEPDDPRWSLPLAGGALMDVGCYGLHACRALADLAGGEPRVVAARAQERSPGVDAWLDADLEFPSGATASARCSMTHHETDFSCRLLGSRGWATAPGFVRPDLDDRVIVSIDGRERVEHLGTRSSYTYQLEAFTRAVRTGQAMPTDADDAVQTMTLVDACYRAAGLQPRREGA